MMILYGILLLLIIIVNINGNDNSNDIISSNIVDIFSPQSCDKIATFGDHLLLRYYVMSSNGSIIYNSNSTSGKPVYIRLNSNSNDNNAIEFGLKGVCKNTTRKISIDNINGLNLQPFYDNNNNEYQSISIVFNINYITSAEDYVIFSYIKENNQASVIDLIEKQPSSVNAIDENEYSPLMAAIALKNFPIVATLLNARRPTVDVNHKKYSGHNSIIYSLDNPNAAILQALLRRGADPNGILTTDDSMGNSALHLACYLEKEKHAELLLQYGANPILTNKFGFKPLDLLPKDASPSNKIHFKRIFAEAIDRWNKDEKTLVVEGEDRKLPEFRYDL